MSKQAMQQGLDALEYGLPCMGVGQRSKACSAMEALRAAIAAPEPEPVAFLADATRFKVRGDADSEACRVYGVPSELNGRWVALVAADDDCHMKLTAPPDTEALRKELERVKGERDAMEVDAALWRAHKARKDAVITAGMGRKALRDIAAQGEGA